MFKIKKVIFNNPATIVYWEDGTKTVVKCGENDIFDEEKGLAMAICKKALGNKGNFNEVFKKHLPQYSQPKHLPQYSQPFEEKSIEEIRRECNKFCSGTSCHSNKYFSEYEDGVCPFYKLGSCYRNDNEEMVRVIYKDLVQKGLI